jgi:hypothetical protein
MRLAFGVLVLTMVLAPGAASAELPIPWDEILHAVHRAGIDLAKGEDRAGVLEDLDRAIAAHPESEHLERARRLRADLAFSIEAARAGAGSSGEGFPPTGPALMETAFPLHLAYYFNRDHLPRFFEEKPDDPMTLVLTADRHVVEALIPLLGDPSPTRSYVELFVSPPLPSVPRVSDVALSAIEYHSRCQFRDSSDLGKGFHELPSYVRKATIERIREWWEENRSRSVADGIRAQLPRADFPGQVWMARNLAAVEGERELALEHLRSLVRRGSESSAAYAAETLAELGDLSAVDILYERWKHVGNVAGEGPFQSSTVYFLMSHGGRREWQLLHRIAEIEVRDGLAPGTARVYAAVVRSRTAATCPWAIPTLALALKDTELSGSRSLEGVDSQPFALADNAAERLQDLTGVAFGYRPEGSVEERLAAIERARAWWEAEGRERYTFDFIATLAETEGSEAGGGGCPERP